MPLSDSLPSKTMEFAREIEDEHRGLTSAEAAEIRMSPLSLGDWRMCAAAAIASMVPFELAKVVFRRR